MADIKNDSKAVERLYYIVNKLLSILSILTIVGMGIYGFLMSKGVATSNMTLIIITASIFVGINILKVFIGYPPMFLPESHRFRKTAVILQALTIFGLLIFLKGYFMLGLILFFGSGVLSFLLARDLFLSRIIK